MAAPDRKLTGSAGEHHVCSMLARYGWAASLTRDGLERTDILAVHATQRWMIDVLVRLGEPPAAPECFVVPRDHVAAATWIGHMTWLTSRDAPPGKRNAGIEAARIADDEWRAYRDLWADLQRPTKALPVRLPLWMRAMMREPRVLLPEGHPWWLEADVPEWPGP